MFFKLSAFYFFYFAAIGIYIIFLPKVLHDIGYNAFDIGVILAAAPLMKFITPFLFLKHINLTKSVFKLALVLAIMFTSFFYISINYFFLLLINNALIAICLSLILPYLEIIAISKLGKEKYGKSRLFGSIGFTLIALVLGQFLDKPYTAIHYYLFTIILTTIFASLLLKYDIEYKNNVNDESFSLLKHWAFWLSLFFMQVSFGGFYNFFTIYETSHNISLEMTSYLWSFGVICEILMLYFQAPILKNNLLFIIKFCVSLTVFRWLILYLYPESLVLTFLSQSLHAFSFGLFYSATIMYLYDLYTNKKLAQQFMYGITYGLGGFLGAFVAGITYGEYLFLYSTVFALISFIFLFFIKE